MKISDDRNEAFHILAGTAIEDMLPSVIRNFIYFADIDEVFHARRKIRHILTTRNQKYIYTSERLPLSEAELRFSKQVYHKIIDCLGIKKGDGVVPK